ncbi:hypothetical protein M514_22554 [Trichuris suis]|uniref:Uncharacterized protein n=1 Tax=Trichuris suis TaxID=68888 RepID=A0A085N730_9BILA|nr:hypothetical protein M514_22554 [Trichuris suis]
MTKRALEKHQQWVNRVVTYPNRHGTAELLIGLRQVEMSVRYDFTFAGRMFSYVEHKFDCANDTAFAKRLRCVKDQLILCKVHQDDLQIEKTHKGALFTLFTLFKIQLKNKEIPRQMESRRRLLVAEMERIIMLTGFKCSSSTDHSPLEAAMSVHHSYWLTEG